MKRLLAILFLFALTGPAPAQQKPAPPEITLPKEIKAEPREPITVRVTTTGVHISWWIDEELKDVVPPELLRDTETVRVLWAKTPGVYHVHACAAKGDYPSVIATCVVTIGTPTPPVPPVPPTPPVPPVPPMPAYFRVLVVYESADLSKYPKEQVSIFTAQEVRAYLNAHCKTEADGKTKSWRVLDKDADMTNESVDWQVAMKLPRQSLPWVIIGNGTDGYSGPLPANVADAMALLKRYGGQ